MGTGTLRRTLAVIGLTLVAATAFGQTSAAKGQPWIGVWENGSTGGNGDRLTLTADTVTLEMPSGEMDPDSRACNMVRGPLTASGAKMTWTFQYYRGDLDSPWEQNPRPRRLDVIWKMKGDTLILEYHESGSKPYTSTYERITAPAASTAAAPAEEHYGPGFSPKDEGSPSGAVSATPAAAAQGPNPLLGTWVGGWKLDTVTYTYTYFTYNGDGTYRYEGTFRESKSGVSGTIAGGGTFTQDMEANTYTTNGNLVRKSTAGPAQFYPYFDVTLSGPSTWVYSVNEKVLTVSQSMNGAMTTITLTRSN